MGCSGLQRYATLGLESIRPPPKKWNFAEHRYGSPLTVLSPTAPCLASLQWKGIRGLSLMFLSRTWGVLDSACFSQQLPETTGGSTHCFTEWRSAASRSPIQAIPQQSWQLPTIHRYFLASLAHPKHTEKLSWRFVQLCFQVR